MVCEMRNLRPISEVSYIVWVTKTACIPRWLLFFDNSNFTALVREPTIADFVRIIHAVVDEY
ncbi:hypothetical protein SAMN05444414_102195 [Roseovarius marisflavi]|uniref:Uncharacterized protein n=1 Tax=Roseovarius marisflavi TaxID=1054996 RepID=A0A1M6W9L1_9RHOB|nr:hypothetical protein SAMN05444414_102195 [Roseovarius marisflavi]